MRSSRSIESSSLPPMVGVPDRLSVTFSAPVRDAIKEEKKLRTGGACFWDSFRRISFLYILIRGVGFLFLELIARSWQRQQDMTTLRPRSLRRTKDGSAVYGGTLERNRLATELKKSVRKTLEGGYENTRVHAKANLRNADQAKLKGMTTARLVPPLRLQRDPLLPAVETLVGRSRELLKDFVAGYPELQGYNMARIPGLTAPVVFFADNGTEMLVEITESFDKLPSASAEAPKYLTARMVLRITHKPSLGLKVVSVDAFKEDERPAPGDLNRRSILSDIEESDDEDASSPDNRIFSLRKESTEESHTPVVEEGAGSLSKVAVDPEPPMRLEKPSFFAALEQAYSMNAGEEKIALTQLTTLVEVGWNFPPEEKDDPVRAKAIRDLKADPEFSDWKLGRGGDGDTAEDGFPSKKDLRVISSVLGRRLVILDKNEYSEAPLKVAVFGIDGKITYPSSTEDCRPQDELPEMYLRKEGETWKAVDASELFSRS